MSERADSVCVLCAEEISPKIHLAFGGGRQQIPARMMIIAEYLRERPLPSPPIVSLVYGTDALEKP